MSVGDSMPWSNWAVFVPLPVTTTHLDFYLSGCDYIMMISKSWSAIYRCIDLTILNYLSTSALYICMTGPKSVLNKPVVSPKCMLSTWNTRW